MSNLNTPRDAEQGCPDNAEGVPEISPEERRKLATCCAFFKAERYREADPATLRESDVREAEDAIAAAVSNCRTTHRHGEGL